MARWLGALGAGLTAGARTAQPFVIAQHQAKLQSARDAQIARLEREAADRQREFAAGEAEKDRTASRETQELLEGGRQSRHDEAMGLEREALEYRKARDAITDRLAGLRLEAEERDKLRAEVFAIWEANQADIKKSPEEKSVDHAFTQHDRFSAGFAFQDAARTGSLTGTTMSSNDEDVDIDGLLELMGGENHRVRRTSRTGAMGF